MTQSSCKRDTKSKSHPSVKLARVRVFPCKHPLSYMPEKKKAIQVQLARAWWRVLTNYSGMTRTTVQLKAYDVCNCTITSEIRPADDQSDSRILIQLYD